MQSNVISDMVPPVSRDLGQSLCIITGASRGFGRCLALQIAGLLKPRSVLLLVARSGDKLRELQAELAASEAGRAGLVVRCVIADLGQKEAVEETVRAAKETCPIDIDRLILINNAASLGDVSRFALSFTDPAEVDSYLSLNVSSALSLTAGVISAFPQRQGMRRYVVNISSLCAVRPFPSWVLYCTGKAARDMMFRVLAEEEPDLRVLNYAPGPLDTDMQVEARANTGDTVVRSSFSAMHSQGQLLTCEESGVKLMKLLLDDDFPSGAHLDFYDL
ncbi:sepiapterin reductase a [Megalops cyprinoides]|uniref:sepiapterin reductase a n=1 Tax=Megalops cyprinoides TaxID=118141 RepID=UPI0018654389|nr:sepiapterin reductase a [Megalops cyprinoides]XP_036384360.1 sepiapterin reductase a [Megalops cyprinoides]